MKGVILTGGTGSRLMPLTKAINKNLLPLGNEPLIYSPINLLKNAGIKDILIITGTEHIGAIVATLGSGKELGCNFTYKVQDKPNGIAAALALADGFILKDDKFAVLLGDNIFYDYEEDMSREIKQFNFEKMQCKLFLQRKEEQQRFGIAQLNDKNQIVKIVEKPKNNIKNGMVITGLYLYSGEIIFEIISNLKMSDRGEYEISHVNEEYVKRKSCSYYELKREWVDAGTFESYSLAQKLTNEYKHKGRE